MTLLLISFAAGMLTILAPCVLPLLPIIVGGAVSDVHNKWKPYIITGSLAISVIFFTLILKATTALIVIPQSFWSWFSGGILLFFGFTMLFPDVWEKISVKLSFGNKSQQLLAKGSRKKGVWGDILMGAALGPVFSSCSPTYFVILATVLPASFGTGLVYLIAYAAGLSVMLLAVALLGQKFASKLTGVSDPHGWFKRGLGILFLIVGLAIISGYDKVFESYVLDAGVYDAIGGVENTLLEYDE